MEATQCQHQELRTYVRGRQPIIGCILCGTSRVEVEGEQLQFEPSAGLVIGMTEEGFQEWLNRNGVEEYRDA